MNKHLSSAELKALSKSQLFGNYGIVIGIFLIHILCTLPLDFIISPLSNISLEFYYILLLLVNLLNGFFIAGEALVYLKIACHERPAVIDLFYYFKSPYPERGSKVVRIQLILSAVSVVCTMPYTYVQLALTNDMTSRQITNPASTELPFNPLLFLVYAILLVTGCFIQIFVQLLFSQVFYLMLDFPEYSGPELLRLAPKLIKGHKARLFYIMISFFPLVLLCVLSCGIGYLWVYPYIQTTYANFYLDLVQKRKPDSLS